MYEDVGHVVMLQGMLVKEDSNFLFAKYANIINFMCYQELCSLETYTLLKNM